MDSHNNGSVSVSNVDAPNSTNSNGSKLNSDEVDEDDDGWEFKSAEWETGTKSQDVKVIERICLRLGIIELRAEENAGNDNHA